MRMMIEHASTNKTSMTSEKSSIADDGD
jgi:hypothetical protein